VTYNSDTTLALSPRFKVFHVVSIFEDQLLEAIVPGVGYGWTCVFRLSFSLSLSYRFYVAMKADNFLCLFFFYFSAQIPGTTQDHLQIFNIELKSKMKSYQMPEQVHPRFLPQSIRLIDCMWFRVLLDQFPTHFVPTFTLWLLAGGILEVDHSKVTGACHTVISISLVHRRYEYY
jgi:hypothetical protein